MPPTSREVFLSKLDIFSDLEVEELEALAFVADEYEYDAGSVIAYQRDLADKMVIVRSGRLYAFQADNNGVVRNSRSYNPGDYFEDTWLFTPKTHSETLRGSEGGRLIFIENKKFLEYLEQFPEIVDYLRLSDEARQAADRSPTADTGRKIRSLSLLQDEMIEYQSRRSKWLLVLKLLGPLILFLALSAFLAWQTFLSGTLTTPLWTLSAILFGGFAIWRTMDWSNDYFAITNKHLIHHEYSLRRFRATVIKTPIDQIQSVEVERPSLLATLSNTGTARITTASQKGSIIFDFIDDPEQVEQIINELRERVRAVDAGRSQALMRASVEEHFNAKPAYSPVLESEDDYEEYEDWESPWDVLRNFVGGIFRGVGSRVEEGNTITYRKHIFTMFGRIWLPLLIGFVLAFAVTWIKGPTVRLILGGLLIVDMLWLVWRFEDWRNDTFQLTDRYVIDIDRVPFGFGESRKQAELGNIQNVNADRPGLLATLFNYGFVQIETAGATADITFERVVNPNRVQSDIFERREAYKKLLHLTQGAERRKEYAVLLDVYHQALEQNRIPQRTPQEGERTPGEGNGRET